MCLLFYTRTDARTIGRKPILTDPWPPGPKKATPKERTPSKVSFSREESVIPMEELSPSRSSPLPLSPPEVPTQYLGPYEGLRFNIREHLHDALIKEEKRGTWEPWRCRRGAKLVKGQNLCQSDLSLHLLSGFVPLGEQCTLQYNPRWVEGVVRRQMLALATVNSFTLLKMFSKHSFFNNLM